MRNFLRVLGVIAATCSVLLFVTLTFAVSKKVWFGGEKSVGGSKKYVAILDLTGVIMSSHSFVKDLKKELENPDMKAIVVRINSPGGLVAPSQEIFRALEEANKKVPVVASMASLAASGGYYAALGARTIYANPGTLTASIGVIMEFVNTEKLYSWAKVERFTLKAGKFKDVGSPFRRMTEEERALMTRLIDDIHTEFRTTVQTRRNLTQVELDNVADGRVLSGAQAKTAKLVDELGGFEDAVKAARAAAQLPADAPTRSPERDRGVLRPLLYGDDEEVSFITRLSALLPQTPITNAGFQILMLAPLAN